MKITNVCSNLTWEGFLTNPKAYLSYLIHEDPTKYALVVDSDVIFNNVTDVSKVWNKYWNIVGSISNTGKDLLIYTETNCWVNIRLLYLPRG